MFQTLCSSPQSPCLLVVLHSIAEGTTNNVVSRVRKTVETHNEPLATVIAHDHPADRLKLQSSNLVATQLNPLTPLPQPNRGRRNPVAPEVAEKFFGGGNHRGGQVA